MIAFYTVHTQHVLPDYFLSSSHHQVIVIIMTYTSRNKRQTDSEVTIYNTADEAYDAVEDGQSSAYVAIEVSNNAYPSNGIFDIGSGIPETNVPLRAGHDFRFFLRSYPLDVSI